MNKFFVLMVCALGAHALWAAPKTVTLAVPGMDCPVCPLTVKKSLSKVPGVEQATVNFDRRQAVVRFDDSKATVEALTRATKDAGYPSTVVGNVQ